MGHLPTATGMVQPRRARRGSLSGKRWHARCCLTVPAAIGARFRRMDTVLFTGFPGFLGSELLPRALARIPDAEAVCLVQPKYLPLAQARLRELDVRTPGLADRTRIVAGDIVEPDLGLAAATELTANVVEIFHLAAVYDLSVARELAVRVNVQGTAHMLAFAARCPRLR